MLLPLVALLLFANTGGSQEDPGRPSNSQDLAASAAAELRAAPVKPAVLGRALMLLKRPELLNEDSAQLLLVAVLQALASERTGSITETIGRPGESAEFRLGEQPDGTVFVCFNSSSLSEIGAGGETDVQLMRAGGRVQLQVVPYSDPVTKKPLQQLELAIGPLNCWDSRRRYSCSGLQPGDAVVFSQFRVSVAFC